MDGGSWKSGVALCAVTVLGAALAAVLIPKIFARTETDLDRTRFLLGEIKKMGREVPAPEIVVLGNSVTMNGVDTKIISSALPGKPVVYNFSSTGQSIAEGYLYLQELPEKTTTVVLVVSPANLEDDRLPGPDITNTFYMEGYRIKPETLETLQSIFTEKADRTASDALTKNDIQQRFHSRWAMSQIPDTEFRKKLRTDLETSQSIRSLTAPAPYSKPISKGEFDKLLPTYNKEREKAEFTPLRTQVRLIEQISDQIRPRNFIVVLAPMHPDRLKFLGPKWIESKYHWVQTGPLSGVEGVPLLDLSELLTSDQDFLDVVHPSPSGREKLSKAIAGFLDVQLNGGAY